MGSGPALSPQQITEAIDLRRRGLSWRTIAARYGVHMETARRAADPDFASDRNAKARADRADSPKPFLVLRNDPKPSAADLDARMAEIPKDTRSLTARLCGDPLPGRSARDRKLNGEER